MAQGKVIVSSQPLNTPPQTPSPTKPSSSQQQPPLTPGTYAAAISETVNIAPLNLRTTRRNVSPTHQPRKDTSSTTIQSHGDDSSSTTDNNFPPLPTSQPKKSTHNPISVAKPGQTKKSTTATNKAATAQATTTAAPTPMTEAPTNAPTIGNDETRSDEVESVYEEITKWRRNLFNLPKGNLGKKFVDEKTKLLNQWVTTNEEQYLMLLMMMPNLLLQRTSRKTKARENKNHLERRMTMWEGRKLNELMEEGKCIQSRLPTIQRKQTDDELIKSFRNHMLRGNVNKALRLLDQTTNKGVLPITDDTIRQLHEKHPVGEPQHDEMLLNGPIQHVHPIIFDDINGELVQKVAMRMKGAAGPSCYDSDDWKTILVSRQFGSSSGDLCDAVANVAKTLCTEDRTVQGGVSALMACRLIPLDKDPGLRPIGIGEVLRRIIGKIVVYILKSELTRGCGGIANNSTLLEHLG